MKSEEILPDVLSQDDRVTITVSHQMYIDGDQTWITYRISGKVEEGEQFHDTHTRIMDGIGSGMKSAVKETVRNMREMETQK